ncbi:MAG: 3'(2'),5'-bisphosphate nucleotidase CysQ [Flavobacteriales bacterium]|jgi:3'(2'), 5'-bisphosphate nucleotidase|nr:3'(2'),5'-bisphosphate nucleotidase CysQ [Flavobacteriales bacterium]MBK7942743.1 3'(2'),5'-bisphosphate nucleotidase CysQ [Flavobacteriales bacterium]MBK8950728.1 3'(2'),5'-bisphosphate nucleotidase CysQ [Flavobacteriales bacterium]
MQHTAPGDLLGPAIAAAFEAGRAILEVYADTIAVELKDDRSPLTEADRRAHRSIVAALAPTALPVLSEEGSELPVEERQRWHRYWLVDPLDGTKEFIKRNGEFTVNIALMERDGLPAGSLGAARPIAGVLYVPVKDLLYFAWPGGGAHRLQQAATRGSSSPYELAAQAERLPLPMPQRPFTIVASRSHASPETEAYIDRMRTQHGEVALTSMGSALKIALVAEGSADAYPRYAPTMEWDSAAGHAIAHEAGRTVDDITTGGPLRYNKESLVNNWFIVH